MPGELDNEHVIIKDQREASQIYNKGYHGEPMSGGSLKLTLIEAALLQELGRIDIFSENKKFSLEDLVCYATKRYPSFEIKYIVYRDVRQRGYIIKPLTGVEDIDFEVFSRGGIPGKTKSKFWVSAISERAEFSIAKLSTLLSNAKRSGRQLLLGIVDEEGDLTYYRAVKIIPKAQMTLTKPDPKGVSTFLEDRVMVWDAEFAERLLKTEFYGKQIGKALQLSLAEARYLVEEGILSVRDVKNNLAINTKKLVKKSKQIQSDFELRFKAYKDMKQKGLIVKTGFKYGTHFRVYDNDPDKAHARYLVHAIPENYESTWPEISRAVRLAHGVKKEILFARVFDKEVEYIRIGRVRP